MSISMFGRIARGTQIVRSSASLASNGLRTPLRSVPAIAARSMSSLQKKENVDELLGQTHDNVEYVVSNVAGMREDSSLIFD